MLFSARITITGRGDAEMEVTSTAYALPGAVSASLVAGAAVALAVLGLIARRRSLGATARFASPPAPAWCSAWLGAIVDHHDQHRGLALRGGRRHHRRGGHDRRGAGRFPRCPGCSPRSAGPSIGGLRWSASCSTSSRTRCCSAFGSGSSRRRRPAPPSGSRSPSRCSAAWPPGLIALPGAAPRPPPRRRHRPGLAVLRAGRRRPGPAAGGRRGPDPHRRRPGARRWPARSASWS